MGQRKSLWCQTLGRLALYAEPDGSTPVMEAGKPLAALVYLALAPKARVERDHLAELLWPGVGLEDARHSLRQALYRVREATGSTPVVRASKNALELVSEVRLDCLEAEGKAVDGDGVRAYEQLRGNFLEGFSIPESREFESWAEAQRVRFRECRAGIAEQLARRHLAEGHAEAALAVADELAALRPFSDVPVRIVMEALARLGRHATALARFHAYVELLKREVDDEAGDELARYARELEEYLRTRPEPSTSSMPFVGRAGEWSMLEAAWGSALEARSHTVLVEGAAGFGKSRMLQELGDRVRAANGVALAAKGYEIERAVPYGVVAEALGAGVGHPGLDLLNRVWLAEVARILPGLRERFSNLPDPLASAGVEAGKHRMHEAVARYLEAITRRAPVLVAVDDLQWADGPSLELLHHLIHTLRGARLLVVGSYRPAELSPVARQFARSVCSEQLADLITLAPLGTQAVIDLLAALGRFDDDSVATTVATHLHRHSGGNPLFLGELLGALDRGRLLAVFEGRWQLASGAHLQDLPRTLGKLLGDRIDALAPWMRACVETLAVAAAETSTEVLARALDMSEPRAELALSVLEEERLVRRTGAGLVELVHDELRRLVYQGVVDARRRLLHGAVGLGLESLGEAKRSGGAARLAYHFDQSGDQERAHRYALQAAGEAGALSATEAERAHLELAAAHSPRALPPASTEKPSVRRVRWRSGGVVLSAATAVGIAGVLGGLYLRPAMSAVSANLAIRQGTLYLAPSGEIGATHQVRWGLPIERARVVPLADEPTSLPPRVVAVGVREGGERHAKVFLLRGSDTMQLTRGTSDDAVFGWTPDGRSVVVERGWKADRGRYQQNIFLLDSAGGIAHQLTNTLYQDQGPAWAPTGTRFAFTRDSLAIWTVWLCEADGTHCEDLTIRFRLPDAAATSAFAPDGEHLALVFADSALLCVVDLSGDASNVLRFPVDSLESARPLWSPDGRWVALSVHWGDHTELRAVPTSGVGPSRLLATLQGDLRPTAWTGGRSTLVDRVAIEPRSVSLRAGAGLHVLARTTTASGTAVETPLRWSVGDSSIARVDQTGFARGRAPGATVLVASAGGWR
ncbi:MAG: AAA family ATPase, partial [Gemmatimonadota bacterium]